MKATPVLVAAFVLGLASPACALIGGIEDLELTGSLDAGLDALLDAPLDAQRDAPTSMDAAMDVSALPCNATPDAGTICATVDTDPKNPPPAYGALDPGVGKLDINGKGALIVFLFAKDPTGGCDPYVNIPPAATISVPASGQGLGVEQLPVTAVGSAPPGTYFVFAFFEDDGPHAAAKLVTRGTGVNAPLPGDLITPVDTGTTSYPTVTLTANQTTRINLTLQPLRGLQIDFQPSTSLKTEAAADPSIKADGPGSIILFDGDGGIFNPSNMFLDFAAIPCVNMKVQTKPSDVFPIVGVKATGTHLIYDNVYDYALPNVCTNPLPAGSLESSENGTPVTIDPAKWLSPATVPIIGLGRGGTGAGTGAPALCK